MLTAMSPVSRGRKKKSKQGKTTKARSTRNTVRSPFAGTRLSRPDWFDASIKNVMAGAEATLSAGTPRELEQVVSELLGAELYQAMHVEREGLHFEWWFHELVDAAAARLRESREEAAQRLLRGMAAISSPALRAYAEQNLPRRSLGDVPHVRATGEIWRMRDVYGTRYAVVAGFSYPGFFLFDVEASGFVTFAGADVFDTVEQAAAAWRDRVGDSAESVEPVPVRSPEELLCLTEFDVDGLMGDESRNVMDNQFRVNRRLHDLADADLLPHWRNLYGEIDPKPMTEEFTTWYKARHNTLPDAEIAEEIALEWMEGKLPETWHSVSPLRITHLRGLISDWVPEFVTAGEALLPEWARWLIEKAGLPERLAEPVFTALSHATGAVADG